VADSVARNAAGSQARFAGRLLRFAAAAGGADVGTRGRSVLDPEVEHVIGLFRRFVRETGYVTVAERQLDSADYPAANPDLLVPGSLVFLKATGPRMPRPTRVERGKSCRRRRSGSSPRGELEAEGFAWGDEHFPDGKAMADTWQGEFPWQNLKLDGYEGTFPVGTFPPNGYGLDDMTGNVWEWTRDLFTMQHDPEPRSPCCAPSMIQGERFPRKVIKGGSHLCAPNNCLRYRPAARQGESTDTSTAHISFGCIVRSRG
jgi:formylglycine-generating enzyme